MAAPDFRVEPLDPRLRIVHPADSARRGRDERPSSGDAGGSEPGPEADGETGPPAPDPGPPGPAEPKLDILARGWERGPNLTALSTGNAPGSWLG